MNIVALVGFILMVIFAISGILFATHRRRSNEPLLEDFVEEEEEE